MIKIDYPPYQPRIKKEDDKEFIFDEVRKKWMVLTPEEWVRQNFLQYLIQVKKYPASLIAVEKEIAVADTRNRFDIVVYNKDHQPYMIVECKEMGVVLDKKTLDQVLRYNMNLKVSYLIITNGSYCFAFSTTGGVMNLEEEIPAFE
ncbi:MAG TPA: type I restriction enzyme HsdR N-terminal domain-containing protein [Ferruginibacter sp.]|nr:type I restriction enzyme HsdR N-terminal domain-containing protein [Ferruginibacter sp.]HPH89821.1 type I restriction enzyme HsdR N-terminal domain-containing protein [Ferruginibacter sp.]